MSTSAWAEMTPCADRTSGPSGRGSSLEDGELRAGLSLKPLHFLLGLRDREQVSPFPSATRGFLGGRLAITRSSRKGQWPHSPAPPAGPKLLAVPSGLAEPGTAHCAEFPWVSG